MAEERVRRIEVSNLARVEGEGSLRVEVRGDKVEHVELGIFEPPRFFEAFLRGRDCMEVIDITARICGICPVAYQMSAAHALEKALGISIEPGIRQLRRLLYCGEWIESHALHAFMLHAPDFLGYEDSLEMANDHPQVVKDALALKKAGNAIVEVLGGRSVHPINVRLGGFYRLPTREQLLNLTAALEDGVRICEASLAWAAKLEYPDLEKDYLFVAVQHDDEYPFNQGRIAASNGLAIDVNEYEHHFHEEHVQRSNALHSYLGAERQTYHVGPMARFALNYPRLPQAVQDQAEKLGLANGCRNPYKSLLVRLLETHFACLEALNIIQNVDMPSRAFTDFQRKSGAGEAATEAPRGLLYHRYELDNEGRIALARIIPPTSQNQKIIEDDLLHVVQKNLHLEHQALTHRCEQTIRNYDPCISCATHFLDLTIVKD